MQTILFYRFRNIRISPECLQPTFTLRCLKDILLEGWIAGHQTSAIELMLVSLIIHFCFATPKLATVMPALSMETK